MRRVERGQEPGLSRSSASRQGGCVGEMPSAATLDLRPDDSGRSCSRRVAGLPTLGAGAEAPIPIGRWAAARGGKGAPGIFQACPSGRGRSPFRGRWLSVESHRRCLLAGLHERNRGCWLACRQRTQASAGRWGQDTGVSAVVSAGVRTSGSTGSRSSFSISIWSRSSAGLSVVSSLSP